jgi:hypothetical protein
MTATSAARSRRSTFLQPSYPTTTALFSCLVREYSLLTKAICSYAPLNHFLTFEQTRELVQKHRATFRDRQLVSMQPVVAVGSKDAASAPAALVAKIRATTTDPTTEKQVEEVVLDDIFIFFLEFDEKVGHRLVTTLMIEGCQLPHDCEGDGVKLEPIFIRT